MIFTGTDGEAVTYEVAEMETLQPTQDSEMVENDYDLTLFTCAYGGQAASRCGAAGRMERVERGGNATIGSSCR